MIKITLGKKAFTLIEVLVACAILIIVVTSAVALGVTIINNATLSRQRITAYYLAQEGIETTRQIRDSNLIDGNDRTAWNTFDYTYAPLNYSAIYRVTTSGNRLFLANNPNGEDIIIDGVTYRRKVTFAPAGIDIPGVNIADNAVRVIINVGWNYKGNSKQIETRELITNWKQQL